MDFSVKNENVDLSRIAAYTLYNLGGGIIVGLARTIIAVAHIAKHYFYQKTYQQVVDKPSKNGGMIKKLKQAIESVPKKINNSAIKVETQARIDEWKIEAMRGLSELLYFGAPYHTYQENFKGKCSVDWFKLGELKERLSAEKAFDSMVSSMIPRYQPWF